jgi:hypothetical protein
VFATNELLFGETSCNLSFGNFSEICGENQDPSKSEKFSVTL